MCKVKLRKKYKEKEEWLIKHFPEVVDTTGLELFSYASY